MTSFANEIACILRYSREGLWHLVFCVLMEKNSKLTYYHSFPMKYMVCIKERSWQSKISFCLFIWYQYSDFLESNTFPAAKTRPAQHSSWMTTKCLKCISGIPKKHTQVHYDAWNLHKNFLDIRRFSIESTQLVTWFQIVGFFNIFKYRPGIF